MDAHMRCYILLICRVNTVVPCVKGSKHARVLLSNWHKQEHKMHIIWSGKQTCQGLCVTTICSANQSTRQQARSSGLVKARSPDNSCCRGTCR